MTGSLFAVMHLLSQGRDRRYIIHVPAHVASPRVIQHTAPPIARHETPKLSPRETISRVAKSPDNQRGPKQTTLPTPQQTREAAKAATKQR